MVAIFRTSPLILILLATLSWSRPVEMARAATPLAPAMGPGDSWNGVHSFLVFAPEPEGNFTPAHMTEIARRYDFGWSPRHVKALTAGNPGIVTGVYYTSTQVDRDKKWIDANHPDWIVYKADGKSPVTQFEYKALTFDISNPEVVAYQFETMKKLGNTPRMAVAWDNCYLDNSLGAVGVRGKDGKWAPKFLGKGSYAEVYDPAWTDAVIEQLRVVHDRLHALRPNPVLLVPNADVKVISGDSVRSAKFIDAVDGVLIEGGYFGPHYVGDPRKLWLRGLRFVEKMQAAGKTYYSIEVPPNGRPVTKDYLQFTLASYLLAKGHTARILLAQPTKSGYDSGNPDACWHPECDAPIGTPLAPMRQVVGDHDTEDGVYLREHSGGVSIVNASTKNSFTVALPGSGSYTDLYGKSVGSTVTMRPVSGLVLLRKGAAKTATEAQPDRPNVVLGKAGDHKDELKVAKVRRISHPGFAAGQCTFGIRDPWNYDRSRLMYNEGADFTGKQPYYYWSPVVWGFVSELKHWKTAEEYQRARKHVNEDRHFGFSANLWWSVFPGEENIMYAAHLASKKVVRFNVDTERMTDVCSYDPGDGRDLSHVRLMGWTTDSKLIVTLGDNNGDVIPEKGGWEIDVKTKTRTYVPVARDDYSRWPAIGSHGHGTFSPDRSMYFRCGGNELRALPSQKLIRTFSTWQRDPPFSLEHLSWRASNDWFTSESGGPQWNRIAAKTGKWPTEPLLDKITIYQIWTDGEIKPLLTTVTACAWSGKDGVQHWNYEGEPIPDHRRDGRQLIFPSYDGVYSADDHASFGSGPWGYCGLFLADLVPAAGNDDKAAPSTPTKLSGVFDPTSQSIRLTWARSTDNVGVDAYHVYRNGEKIATTGFIDYTDAIKGPLSASYRYSIGAVDVAGNEARSSEIVVRAAR